MRGGRGVAFQVGHGAAPAAAASSAIRAGKVDARRQHWRLKIVAPRKTKGPALWGGAEPSAVARAGCNPRSLGQRRSPSVQDVADLVSYLLSPAGGRGLFSPRGLLANIGLGPWFDNRTTEEGCGRCAS